MTEADRIARRLSRLIVEPLSRDEFFFTSEELATRWRTNPGTLANQRCRGEGPRYVKILTGKGRGGRILYPASEIIKFELGEDE